MVEGGAQTCPRTRFSKRCLPGMRRSATLESKRKFAGTIGKAKRQVPLAELDHAVVRRVEDLALTKLKQALEIPEKLERYKRIAEVKSEVVPQALAEFPDKQKDIKGAFEDLKRKVFRDLSFTGAAHRRPWSQGHPADHLRSGGAAAHARLGAIHPRRNPGAGSHHVGHHVGRAEGRCLDRRAFQELHAALQFPAVQRRRSEIPARPGPARNRPRRSGRTRADAASCPTKTSFPYTIRIVSEILESNGSIIDGHGMRRLAGADGCGRADQGAGARASPWV